MKLNRILLATALLILISYLDCFAQVRVQYENPEIYARDRSGEMPTFRGEFRDKGLLVIDIKKPEVSMISNTGSQRSFTLHSINYEPTSGHYLAFGDGTMFTFMPERRLFTLMYKRNNIYVFELTKQENNVLLSDIENSN